MNNETPAEIAISNIEVWLDELPRIKADIEKSGKAKGMPQLKLKRIKSEIEFTLGKIENENT